MNIARIDIADLIERMRATNWDTVFYDPLHDFIEAETEEDRVAFDKVEQLIFDLQTVHESGPEGKALVEHIANYHWKDQPMEDQIETLFPGSKREKMLTNHVISDEVLDQALLGFSKNENWVAYNTCSYFLEKGDVYFFKDENEARDFARYNISDYDNYKVIYAASIIDLFKQVPYVNELNQRLNNFSNSLNNVFMNDKNFEYLKDNIKYMGFGEKQNDALEQHLKQGKDSFQLTFNTEVNKKPFEAVLKFRKSDKSDMYFFNSYHASLERSNGEKVDQTFYLNNGKGVTAKEAYNLLEGRAVFKELSNKAGDPYKAWIQLDFENKDKNNNNEVKQYHENYGYEVKSAVGKYPIAELDGGEKEKALMQSLQKGNIQSVTFGENGDSKKMFIEANPQYKTLTVYDNQMKRMQKEDLSQYQSLQQSQGKEVKQEQKEELKPDKKKEVKQKIGDDLGGSKKKTSRKKGMSI
jgi:hypothetical protein